MPAHSDVLQYRDMIYWNPVAGSRMEALLDLLDLEPGDRFVELGCGRAELAVRMVERFAVSATAVDRSEHALALAQATVAARVPDVAVELVHRDVDGFRVEPGSLAAVACIGGPRVASDLGQSWRVLLDWLRPGGYLLAGEGFWQAPPDPAYLEATGMPRDDMQSHWENIAMARELGAIVLYTAIASRAEWDEFEGRILHNVERHAASHPGDPEVETMVARRRAFYDAQMRWGRDTMGFGLYLLHKPSP